MNITATLALLVLFLGTIVGLQIFLSTRSSKWFGLILPLISLLYSLVSVLQIASFDNMEAFQIFGKCLTVFLITNLPTLVLLAIYLACRETRKRKKQLDKMNVQDL